MRGMTLWKYARRLALAVALLTLSTAAGAQSAAAVAEADAANRRGAQLFTEGYYVLTPRKRYDEAALKLAQAEKEFKTALSLDGDNVAAHRNLARLCYVQKRFAEAAQHYKRAAELRPGDTDAFVQAALAYTEIRQFDKAEDMLAAARATTTDRGVIRTLDAYSAKIRQAAAQPQAAPDTGGEPKP